MHRAVPHEGSAVPFQAHCPRIDTSICPGTCSQGDASLRKALDALRGILARWFVVALNPGTLPRCAEKVDEDADVRKGCGVKVELPSGALRPLFQGKVV